MLPATSAATATGARTFVFTPRSPHQAPATARSRRTALLAARAAEELDARAAAVMAVLRKKGEEAASKIVVALSLQRLLSRKARATPNVGVARISGVANARKRLIGDRIPAMSI